MKPAANVPHAVLFCFRVVVSITTTLREGPLRGVDGRERSGVPGGEMVGVGGGVLGKQPLFLSSEY